MEETDQLLILRTCLIAGKIMMESGSEVYRVEDTIKRIAKNAGIEDIEAYVTATGVIIGSPTIKSSQIVQVTDQSINLEKVAAVNRGSRLFAEGEITLHELYLLLKKAENETPDFPFWWKLIASGFVSATLMIILDGVWFDFIQTFFIGMIGYGIRSIIKEKLHLNFLNDFLAAFVMGAAAILMVRAGMARDINHIIIGAVMPLVPGLAITNSFRDIFTGHLVSGMARGIEALFIAGSIGGGIAVAFNLFF